MEGPCCGAAETLVGGAAVLDMDRVPSNWESRAAVKRNNAAEFAFPIVPNLIPKGLAIPCLGCFASAGRYAAFRSLMDSSAGCEDHREQIGLVVEAATGDTSRPI